MSSLFASPSHLIFSSFLSFRFAVVVTVGRGLVWLEMFVECVAVVSMLLVLCEFGVGCDIE